ncbi:hypothetical protein GCM10007424_10810 [Flavobacterium suaedae]|uniref:Uncharacterized protein n=1 Tax=Flavobacterium suaedae TaxID=1767027 RepID=A0ABQ1JMB8_9FLAO|nr:hypothetical protein [Flavobacterium suaedae]GGB72700.1 hypothetical protein GCM10007424_10810 [Flavobacterium suaedae]
MKTFLYNLLFILFSISSFSQDFYENEVVESQSGVKFTELKLKVNRLVPIKDVFFIVDTINQTKDIEAVKKLVKESKIDNAVFYFATIPSDLSLKEKEEIFKNIILTFTDRMKMVESHLYAIMPEDIASAYKIEVKEMETKGFGFTNKIRGSMIDTDIDNILRFIVEKNNLLANCYDN